MLSITAFEPFGNRVNGTLIHHSGVELKLAGKGRVPGLRCASGQYCCAFGKRGRGQCVTPPTLLPS